MSFSNLQIGRQKFVVLPQRDFARLQHESEQFHQILAEDKALGILAKAELKRFQKSGGKGIRWEKVKAELGL